MDCNNNKTHLTCDRCMDWFQPRSDVCPGKQDHFYLSDGLQCLSSRHSGKNKFSFFLTFLLWFQVCKFRVGSFNYPMNKIVFYNELIPEDTIIKSILDYKWVYSPTLWFLTISRPGNFWSENIYKVQSRAYRHHKVTTCLMLPHLCGRHKV